MILLLTAPKLTVPEFFGFMAFAVAMVIFGCCFFACKK